MKDKSTPSWLTAAMSNDGLTATVLEYFTDSTAVLPPTLSVKELLLIWSIEGEKFEKTPYFKNQIIQVTTIDLPVTPEYRKLIKEKDQAIHFFMKYLPVTIAATLCTHVFQYSELSKRAITDKEKSLLLEGVKNLSLTKVFSTDEIQWYYEMAKKFPIERAFVEGMINNLILQFPAQAYELSKKIPLSDYQQKALIEKVASGKVKLGRKEVIQLYIATKNTAIATHFIKKLKEKNEEQEYRWLFDDVKETVREVEPKKKGAIIKLLLPIVSVAVLNMDEGYILREGWDKVLEYLPEYEKGNIYIEPIIEKAQAWYTNYQYGLIGDYFLHWYSYVKKEEWIDLFIKSITEWGHKNFQYSLQAYTLSKEERIMDAVIEKGLPKLGSPDDDEDLSRFLDVLQAQQPERYHQAKELILKEKLLSKWWNNLPQYSKGKFFNIIVHFK